MTAKRSKTILNPKLAWPFTRRKPQSKRAQLKETLASLPKAPF